MNSVRKVMQAGALTAILTGISSGEKRPNLGPELNLTVRLYDAAQTRGSLLHSSMAKASALFEEAQIHLTWEELKTDSAGDKGTDMSPARLNEPIERPYVLIRLVRNMPASSLRGALSYALPFAHHGSNVIIFCDRVQAYSLDTNTQSSTILGHAIAHEIGHVLLRSTEHISGGLMQARWNPSAFRLAQQGLMHVDAVTATKMRQRLLNWQLTNVTGIQRDHEPTPLTIKTTCSASSASCYQSSQ